MSRGRFNFGCRTLAGWGSASFWVMAVLVLLVGVDWVGISVSRAKCAFSPEVESANLLFFVLFYFSFCAFLSVCLASSIILLISAAAVLDPTTLMVMVHGL